MKRIVTPLRRRNHAKQQDGNKYGEFQNGGNNAHHLYAANIDVSEDRDERNRNGVMLPPDEGWEVNREIVAEDIAFLLMKSLFVVQWTDPQLLKKLRDSGRAHEWYSLYLPSFMAGYLSIFPREKREHLFEWLTECISAYKNDNKVWYTDTSITGLSHKEYMEPLFSSLRRSRMFFNIDGESVHKRDKNQKTALHQAALEGEWLSLWPLICAGAEVDARDNKQNTPLHEASYTGEKEAVKTLIRAGAKIHAKNQSDETPLSKAKSHKSMEAVQMLQHYGAQY